MAIEPKHKVEVKINIRNVTQDNLSSAFSLGPIKPVSVCLWLGVYADGLQLCC